MLAFITGIRLTATTQDAPLVRSHSRGSPLNPFTEKLRQYSPSSLSKLKIPYFALVSLSGRLPVTIAPHCLQSLKPDNISRPGVFWPERFLKISEKGQTEAEWSPNQAILCLWAGLTKNTL